MKTIVLFIVLSSLVIIGFTLLPKFKEHYADPIKTRRYVIHMPSKDTHKINGQWPNGREFILDEYMSGTILADGKEIASIRFQGLNTWTVKLKGTSTGIVIKAKDRNTIDFGAGIVWKREKKYF